MKIQQDAFVAISYTLTNDAGEVLDQSSAEHPLGFVFGEKMIIPGLEAALEGMVAGDKKKVDVAAKDGYGESSSELLQELPRANFPGGTDLAVGQTFQANTPHGPMRFSVHSLRDDVVVVDLNHPLAGKDLHFDVEVIEVRPATDDDRSPHHHGCGDHDCGSCEHDHDHDHDHGH